MHQAHARPIIKFTCPIPSSLPQWGALMEIFTEAFDTLGYDFSMSYINTKREIFSHRNTNDYDGICIRLETFEEEAKNYNLIIVRAIVGDPYTGLWRNLKNTPPPDPENPNALSPNTWVGYLQGSSLSAKYIEGFPDSIAVSFLRPDLGMKSLAAGRIDYWIGFSHTSDYLNEALNLGEAIEKIGDLRQDLFFPFINERHSEIKAPLEKEITRIMKERGSLVR